ncbi:molecular chaperone Hsp33 [Anaerosolibacter carboniphilus]|uniref:33 kDa chaperonin n=1 Tax=Anaerosolibacter carboniphilus TaxID=1417629 RepID=A0A841L7M2_9FIRM|nr:Hsp33 family molecular chaperone HslO [Anaerosolibacter carboniphilus]MBB6218265.1 molecular chaperone Hsp33 [Anaerosolibacter carboniphilus]
MKNYVVRAVAANQGIRAFAAITTDMVERARQIHDATPVATAALGRTLTAGAMMGVMLKGDHDKISIQIKGDGPLKQILVAADSKGNVKGYVANPFVDIPLREDGKLDVGSAVGKDGKIVVIKDLGLKEPYIGQLELTSGEIAEDITAYFAVSEQQPSAVALGVLIDRDQTVKASGGFIIQPLPGVRDEIITIIEDRLSYMPPITEIIDGKKSAEEVLEMILDGMDVEILEKKEIHLNCDCSVERLEKALMSIGAKDLKEVIDEDGQAELTCHFCNTKYHFDREHLERLYAEATR